MLGIARTFATMLGFAMTQIEPIEIFSTWAKNYLIVVQCKGSWAG